MTRNQIIASTLGALMALTGCVPSSPVDPEDKGDQILGGKEDRWNSTNNPERFDGEFNYHVDDLPLEGSAEHEAWPSTYWPTYEDSVNTRWMSGELSPAQKYDQAFNAWTPTTEFMALRPFGRSQPVPGTDWDTAYYEQQGPLATHVSRNMGNARDRDAAVTAMGRPTEDWPVETWWGLCHAWVPAALLEDRPLRSVTHNGVTFHVADLEALLIAAYNRTSSDMIGGRCNTGSGNTTVERDEFGRPVDVDCRDTNPGSMHVIVTNYLGINSRGFAEDRTYDYEVWNQPVAGYEITQQREIDAAAANQLLGAPGDTYTFNADAAKLFEVRMSLHYITESSASTTPGDAASHTRTDRLHYVLEVDQDGKIIGGEWASDSRSAHPDFLWNPRRATRSAVPYLDLDNIRMLVAMSREPEAPPVGSDELVADGMGGIAIPDNDSTGISSSAVISGSGVVANVSVDLDITHPYVGDLLIVLEHGGVERTLHNREGGSSDNLAKLVTVVGFEGLDPAGEWTLRVSDHAGQDTGTLNSWRLHVTVGDGTPITPPSSGATRFEGMGGIAIPDNDATGVSSTATVSGATTTGTVAIDVNITHTYVGDLVVNVTAPTGASFTLHNHDGGSDDNIVRTFPLDDVAARFTGDPNGTWTLHVADNADIDTGSLAGWAVVVTE